MSAGEASGLENPGPVAAAALITSPPRETLKRLLEHLEPLEHQAEDRERAARQAAKNADAYARQVREIRANLKRQVAAEDDTSVRIGAGGVEVKSGLRAILRKQARIHREEAVRLRELRAHTLRKMIEEVVSTVSEDISKRFLKVVNDFQNWNVALEGFHQQYGGGGDAPPRIRLSVQ
jgi:hypothetical protein